MIKTTELFDLSHSAAGEYLSRFEYPYSALSGIKDLVREIGRSLDPGEYDSFEDEVWIHKSAVIAPTACINGPCVIGAGTEVRHCAFIRGSALIGEDCVVGNSVEIKNAILFDGVQVPHYNYVGDSILGYKAHMGAGAVTSNVKSDRSNVKIRYNGECIDTGRYKCGAMLGDHVEVGCNSVLNPGTVIGRNTNVYPLSCVRGTVPANSIYKSAAQTVTKSMGRC